MNFKEKIGLTNPHSINRQVNPANHLLHKLSISCMRSCQVVLHLYVLTNVPFSFTYYQRIMWHFATLWRFSQSSGIASVAPRRGEVAYPYPWFRSAASKKRIFRSGDQPTTLRDRRLSCGVKSRGCWTAETADQRTGYRQSTGEVHRQFSQNIGLSLQLSAKKVWVLCSETVRKFTEPWKHLLAHSQTDGHIILCLVLWMSSMTR